VAQTTYQYWQSVDPEALATAIGGSSISTSLVSCARDGLVCYVTFEDALSGADKETLDGLAVANAEDAGTKVGKGYL